MYNAKLNEPEELYKVGVIPFCTTSTGEKRMMFMIPSDPAYGGSDPQVAKGGHKEGENPLAAALREGEEELGLNARNFTGNVMVLPFYQIKNGKRQYPMRVFLVEVNTQTDFDDFHYETGSVEWLTGPEFAERGRKPHRAVVAAAWEVIDNIESVEFDND